jgi:hypothetical protein
MRSTIAALGCLVAGTLVLLALPASAARADTSAALPQLDGFHQIVADSQAGYGYLFLSEGIGSQLLVNGPVKTTALVVTHLDGSPVATLDSGDGVEGLALSPDGSTLYVALAAQHAVAAIDVSTVAQTTPTQTLYPLGTSDVPYSLAYQTGKVWVSYYTGVYSAIGEIDPTSPPASAFEPDGAPPDWQYPADLAADPRGNNVLVAAEPVISTASAATFTTSTVPATALAPAANLGSGTSACSFEAQIAVAPGGSQFVAGCETPKAAYLYGTESGGLATPVSHYPSTGTDSPSAVAINASGTVAVGYFGGSVLGIYQPDGTLLNALGVPATGMLADDGLAWSADGSQLFAITRSYTGGYSLTVYDNPGLTRSALALSGPSTVVLDHSVTLSGTLTLGSGAPPSGTTVSIARTGPGAATTPVSVPVGSGGGFTFTDHPAAVGAYAYIASYAGQSGTQPATATFRVTVALNKATVTLRNPGVVTFGANVTIAGTMSLTTGAPPARTGLFVVRTQAGSRATRKFFVGTGAEGSFTVTDPHPAKGRYTYTVSYAGNTTITPGKAVLTVTVARTAPYLALKTSAADDTYGKRVIVTATLGPTFADRSVSIYAKPAGEATRRLKTGRVNARGNLTVSYTVSRNTTFTVVFAGDVHNAPREAGRGVGVWVKVYMSNGGYFKTVVIDHVPYRVYRHTAQLTASSLVVPDKAGECVEFEVQQYDSQIGWFPNQTFGCLPLNRLSKVATTIGLAHAAGARYRMRADYLHGKDATNLSTSGSWFYFEVVN